MQGPTKAVTLDEFKAMLGKEVGVSDWYTLDQKKIDAFADLTDDHQFIHVNPELAKLTPFGTTIAHGFFTLSMVAAMGYQAVPAIKGAKMGLNYGLNKARFLNPVKSGKRIRGRFTLKSIEEQPGGRVLSICEAKVEIEGEEKPALVAETIGLAFM